MTQTTREIARILEGEVVDATVMRAAALDAFLIPHGDLHEAAELQDACNIVLKGYRQTNVRARTSPPPASTQSRRWGTSRWG